MDNNSSTKVSINFPDSLLPQISKITITIIVDNNQIDHEITTDQMEISGGAQESAD